MTVNILEFLSYCQNTNESAMQIMSGLVKSNLAEIHHPGLSPDSIYSPMTAEFDENRKNFKRECLFTPSVQQLTL